MTNHTVYGDILITVAELDDNCGYIKLGRSTQDLLAADYPDLFAAIGYSIGGSGDVFRIPSQPILAAGINCYITAINPET